MDNPEKCLNRAPFFCLIFKFSFNGSLLFSFQGRREMKGTSEGVALGFRGASLIEPSTNPQATLNQPSTNPQATPSEG